MNERLYDEFAAWWPVMSDPASYEEEASIFRHALEAKGVPPLDTMLELGSGGGNNASHLKRHFRMTLVDRSSGMLDVSRALNPECEHIQGDMRTVRLGWTFDVVFIHDAIVYLTTEDDLRAALETARLHCRPGGIALFVPDWTKESFTSKTSCGGHDRDGRSFRYLEWCRDPDPTDDRYTTSFAYLLQEGDGPVRVEQDSHEAGLFARDTWLRFIADAGFVPEALPFRHSSFPKEETHELFVGLVR